MKPSFGLSLISFRRHQVMRSQVLYPRKKTHWFETGLCTAEPEEEAGRAASEDAIESAFEVERDLVKDKVCNVKSWLSELGITGDASEGAISL
jgi:hypothetical protein